MVYASTHALQNSLPNRSPSQRPRSLSLSEYQPLSFDREATALAYRNQLQQPVSSASSLRPGYSGTNSSQSHSTAKTTIPSSLSHNLRRGDNPHAADTSPIDIPGGSGPFFGAADNYAGVGAGHSLTPPQSPVHQAAQQAHRTSLNLSAGVSGSSLESGYADAYAGTGRPRRSSIRAPDSPVQSGGPPVLPRRPSALPESTYPADAGQGSGSGVRRARRPSWLSPEQADEIDDTSSPGGVDAGVMGKIAQTYGTRYGQGQDDTANTADGWESDPGYPRYVGGRHGGRRELPAVPTNVPAPEPPGWEPDYKPQIPAQLTQSSVEHAYAQLSAPPPGLPPRRGQQPRLSTIASSSTMPNIASSSGTSSQYPTGGQASYQGTAIGNIMPGNSPDGTAPYPTNPPAGAPSYPLVTSAPITPAQPKPRRKAEETVVLKADGRTPIWSTHYLDPCLRNSLVHIPFSPQVSTALSGLTKDSAAAAQVDGMARMAKGWFVPPDGRFGTDKGAIELGLGVIDCGGREGEEGWGRDKGRRKARVEVSSRTGGIKLDLIELDENRQIDLKVDTKTGDVLVLLPRTFFGSINITTPGPDPVFCASLLSSLSPISHPYETVYTAYITPPSGPGSASLQSQANDQRGVPGGSGAKKQRWVPEFLRPQEGADGGAAAGEWSKVTIVTQGAKSRVVLGYRDSDEFEAKGAGVMVGMEGQEKKRRWWR